MRIRAPQLRVTSAAVLCALTCSLLLACGLEGWAFERQCTADCAANADRTLCEDYCECAFQWAKEHDAMEQLEQAPPVAGQPVPPIYVQLMSACGSDLYDGSFSAECERACVSDGSDAPTCRTRCACTLRELRGSAPRHESTAFLIENVGDRMTAAGQARVEAADRACTPPSSAR